MSRGFRAADWLLCQPVRANMCAELQPAVFLIRFGQRCCAKQQHFYKCSIECATVSGVMCFCSVTET